MRTIRFLLRRFAAQRLLGLAIVVSLGFTIGVLVAGPIYADASREAIATAAVDTAPVNVRNVRLSFYGDPAVDHAAVDAEIRAATENLPVGQIVTQGRGEARLEGPRGAPVSMPLLFRDGAPEHFESFDGQAPQGPGEVALPTLVAELLHVEIGGTVTAIGPTEERRELRVTGIFGLPKLGDPFWYGAQSPYPYADSTDLPPALLDRQGYLDVSTTLGLSSQFVWDVYLDLDEMPFDEARGVPRLVRQDAARLVEADPELSDLTATTGLDTLFALVRISVDDLRVPILLVVFQVGAVALAVLAGVGSLVLTRQSFELAVLRSRGFSRGKLLAGQTVQAVISAVIAYPVGLLLGAGLASLASRSNGPSLPAELFPIRITGQAQALGLVGAVLGAGVLVLISLPHIRRTILEERRLVSREDRPLLARIPVEAFVLPVAAFTLIELRGTKAASTIGRTSLDPLVLLTPTLLIFGLSFLALRLLLFLLRRLDRRIGRTRRLTAYLAARRLSRAPGTSFATALLLLLSVGLLVVSSSYRAIVLRNQEDTARQQVGADWNVQVAAPEQPLAALHEMPVGATAVVRTVPYLEVRAPFPLSVFAVAVDPGTYRDGGWWRSDYSATSEDEWLDALRVADPAVPIPIGPQPDTLTVDAEGMKGAEGLQLVASVQRPDGEVTEIVLGVLGPDYGGEIRDPGALEGASLLSLTLREQSAEGPDEASVLIRSINGQAAAPILETWEPLRFRGSTATLRPREDGSVELRVRSGVGHVLGGVAPPMEPLPALVSPGIADSQADVFEATIGGQLLEFREVALAEHFPTVPKDFFVVSTPGLLRAAARIPEAGISLSEVWATGEDPSPALRDGGFLIRGTASAAPIEAFLAQLPPSLAVGLDVATAVGGLGLVTIGVAVGLSFAQRRREFEFASLRAMGVEPSRIARVLLLEQGVLVGFAVTAGAGIAFGILTWLLPYVGRNLGAPFPPPVLVIDPVALGGALAAILAATALGILAALRGVLRSSVTGVLRGEAE